MTLEDKIKLVELIQHTFTSSNTLVGYFVRAEFIEGEENNVYKGELYEYSKSTPGNSEVIYTQATVVPKAYSEIDAKLNFYQNMFMNLPVGLALLTDTLKIQKTLEEDIPETKEPEFKFLNQVKDKVESSTLPKQELNEKFIIDCDTDRTPNVVVLPIVNTATETGKLDETYNDPTNVLDALCYATASMIRNIEEREGFDKGKAMARSISLIESLYANPEYEAPKRDY